MPIQKSGSDISGDVLGDLFGWAMYNPETIADYVTPASVVKLAAVVSVLGAIAIIARRARLADRQSSRTATGYRWALLIPATGVMGAALLLLPIGYAHRLPDSAFNVSAVGRAYTTLFGAGGTQDTSTLLTSEQVLDASRQMTRTADFDAGHDLIGRERGSDLIVFMMETGPAQALDFANVGRELPGTGPLFDRAIVARQHYTTHPFSSDAMYSILSGLYPQGRRRLLLNVSDSFNGLMSALAPDVPFRRVYLPSLYQIDLDRGMYAAFGADLYVADEQQSDPLRAVAEHRAETLIADLEGRGHAFAPQPRDFLRARLSADFQTIERMRADITAAVKAGRRYSVMVFPEIGHAPWLALGAEDTVLARGRALMQLQDSWLKEIVDTARTLGRLDRTVIAVTADHGIRTRIEDPALPAGKISDYTFRVPLLIYAPQALAQTVVVTTPTSHIDLAPTLLALFGKTDNVRRMQGVPVWQRRPAIASSSWGPPTEAPTGSRRTATTTCVSRCPARSTTPAVFPLPTPTWQFPATPSFRSSPVPSQRVTSSSARSWPDTSASCARARGLVLQAARAGSQGVLLAFRPIGAPRRGRPIFPTARSAPPCFSKRLARVSASRTSWTDSASMSVCSVASSTVMNSPGLMRRGDARTWPTSRG